MDVCRRNFGKCILGALASQALALPARPKLLVLVVLEQFRAEYLDIAWPRLGARGLRTLIENGAYFPDCRHLASSFPASSIATLATGAWPAQHGIVADGWFDRTAKRMVHASEESLLATTLAAQIAARPNTRIYTVSLAEPHAALFAGTNRSAIFWMDDRGQFAVRGQEPDWLGEYNGLKPIENLRNAKWLAVDARPDAPALRTLTYDPDRPQDFVALYKASPFGQAAQFEFLGELLTRERLGQADTFDFVCLLAGSNALLGYETGARSPLIDQMTLQLDRHIAFLLDQLDKAPGIDSYNLVLAGAHGAPPAPSAEARPRMAVNGERLAQAINQRLKESSDGRVEKYVYPFLYVDASGFRDPEPVRLAAANAALLEPAVAAFFTAGGACSVHDVWKRRFRNSFHPARSGDVMLSYKPEYIEDYGSSRGISYGSLYNYDIRVPLCFFGPQFRAGVFEAPVESVDLAPTLARASGIELPSSATGRVLGEAFVDTVESKK